MYKVFTPLRFIKPRFTIPFGTSPFKSYMKRTIQSTVELNPTENKIKDLLLEFCAHYNGKKDVSSQLVLRITGGWVRDKLLGDESHDLDIAINHLSGEEFVQNLTEYIKQHHPDFPLKTVHTIKKNPEKSKHLETCTTKIYGRDIDFVNLRSEKYTSDSRIPVIECGTAEEDALRRDATLNALFYNLNDSIIEDFTGRGLQDLQDGILRTPLLPLQTFVDDPLRVLRMIRFASRFDFIVDPDTLNAMKDPEIKQSLLHKISRERVGTELEKILDGRNPQYGLRLLNYVDLTDSVFNVGTISEQLHQFNDEEEIRKYLDLSESSLYQQLNGATCIFPVFKTELKNSTLDTNISARLLWLSIVLMPFKNSHLKISNKRSVGTHVPEIIVKEGLRFGKTDFEPVSNILQHLDASKDIFDRAISNKITRSELGLYLRQFSTYSNLNLLVNCFDEIMAAINFSIPGYMQDVSSPLPITTKSMDAKNVIESISKYEQITNKIAELDLQDVHLLKPLLDGKTISKALNKKPGPWMSKVTQDVLIWQLDNPNGTPEACLEYICESQ